MENLILYGAGRAAEPTYHDFKERYNILCLIDQDESKHGTDFSMSDGKKIPIISLKKALKDYPDVKIRITPIGSAKSEIYDYLINTTRVNRELLIDINEYKKSCRYAENVFNFTDDSFYFCCLNSRPKIKYDINISNEDLYKQICDFRSSTVDKFKMNNDPIQCKDCPHIKYDMYLSAPRLLSIIIGGLGVCQFDCCYCSYDDTDKKFNNKKRERLERIIDFIGYMKEKRIIYINATTFALGTGEISINPLRDKLFNVIKDFRCDIHTNAEFYSDGIAEILDNGISDISVSLDAGTRETFAKIKGRDCFDKVVENTKKYCEHGAVALKYIILPGINDNDNDAENFVKIAKEINVSKIVLSRDMCGAKLFDDNIETCYRTAETIIKKAKSYGIKVESILSYFNPELKYKQRIEDLMKKNEVLNH